MVGNLGHVLRKDPDDWVRKCIDYEVDGKDLEQWFLTFFSPGTGKKFIVRFADHLD